MIHEYIIVEQSLGLHGQEQLVGAKNSVLVIMVSLLLTEGVSVLKNVPCSQDVYQMIVLLESLGAKIHFNEPANMLTVDTSGSSAALIICVVPFVRHAAMRIFSVAPTLGYSRIIRSDRS